MFAAGQKPTGGDSWQPRRFLAALVGIAIVLLPVLVGVGASLVFAELVARPSSGFGLLLWWLVAFAISTLTYTLASRVARRALPLAALLKMTLVFPDMAPTRMSVAIRAGSTRALQRQLAASRFDTGDDVPAVAAENILALATSLSSHDRQTRGHSERVRVLTDLVSEELHLPKEDRDRLRWAALLHDIGKLSVAPDILNKQGAPDQIEWMILRSHPLEGARLAAPLASWLGPWAAAIAQHHERFDGSGYPAGLAGEEITLGGRIVAVSDAFETMTAVRSYKPAISAAAARKELTACAGTQFDPTVVRAFLDVSVGTHHFLGAPVAWLGDLPVLSSLPRLGQIATSVGHAVAGIAVAAGAGAAVVASASHGAVPPPPPTAQVTHPASQVPTGSPIIPTPRAPLQGALVEGASTSTLPGAPTAVFGIAGDGSIALAWTPPTTDGGSAITGYSVTTFVGGAAQTPTVFTSPADVESISGLTDGTSYTFTVSAVNGVGLGPASIPSGPVTPVPTLSGPPTALSGIASDGSVALAWMPPTTDGGSAITGYNVTPFIGGVAQPPTIFTSPADVESISGLTNGTSYTFTVSAVTGVGLGPASIPSGPLTPVTLPGPPTALAGVADDSSVTLSWTAPTSDGGSPVTGYSVTPFIGGMAQSPTVFTSPADVESHLRTNQRHQLHLHGQRSQRGRSEPGVGSLGTPDPSHTSGASHRSGRDRR